MRRAAAASASSEGPPNPGLAFLDVERIGIRNCVCVLASVAPAGPLLSLHPGRAHRACASPEVPKTPRCEGVPPISPATPRRVSLGSGQGLLFRPGVEKRVEGGEYGIGDTFWVPVTLPSPPYFLQEGEQGSQDHLAPEYLQIYCANNHPHNIS